MRFLLKEKFVSKPNIFVEMSVNDGIKLVAVNDDKLYWKGSRISRASGAALFVKNRNDLQCICCGIKASKWIAYEVRSQYPVLNLYANKDGIPVLLTQDHIIPKVFGGNDSLPNLRVMCTMCNGERSCNLDEETLDFYHKNLKLVIPDRMLSSVKRLEKGLKSKNYQMRDLEILFDNFMAIFNYLESKKSLPEKLMVCKNKVVELLPLYEKRRQEYIQEQLVKAS